MGKRRLRVIRRREGQPLITAMEPAEGVIPRRQDERTGFLKWYDSNVQRLTFITLFITLVCLSQIAYQHFATGDFIHRGISLKGGTTVTIPTDTKLPELESQLRNEFPQNEIAARILTSAGFQQSVVIESDIQSGDETTVLLDAIEKHTGIKKDAYSVDIIGSSLSESFFKEVVIAMLIAFLFMAIVVFFYFRNLMPSLIVILCAFSDITCTIAAVNLFGIKVSTAGIAAFLMLIGYSVDTDILLTTRLLRRKEGTVFMRTINAAKTGLTMTLTAIAAVVVVLIFSKSEILNQIMTILLIGLVFDIINTWITNVGLIRYYMERKHLE